MNYPLTLLAPARDLRVGLAAIQAGADAIYIGAPKFGAREKAGNSIEDIATLVEAGRPFGVKVLVTLNTLLSDAEREESLEIADALHAVGVDAFIVQDPELVRLLIARGYRVHASTQMDNRTIDDVRARRDMGCRRVVLARELSLDEIRTIHQAVDDIELEAFVHGALCVSYSGRCYMSEVLMGRSANRGACAQMCRMRYDLLDAKGREVLDDNGQPIHQRYLLSLQDMDRSMYIRELVEAGVTTFKIEGRLKDEDYVTNIVAYYRQIIDRLYPSPDADICHYDFEPNPAKTFHRGGTDYFLHGRTPHLANHLTPKSTGERIGVVLAAPKGRKRLELLLDPGVVLHNGDGICISDRGCSVNGVSLENHRCVVVPSTMIEARSGEVVYRNLDTDFIRHLHAERRIPIDICLRQTECGYELSLSGRGIRRVQEFEAEHIPAQNPEKAVQTIRTQLTKLGDTHFAARMITIDTHSFIPAGQLNEWRRTLTY